MSDDRDLEPCSECDGEFHPDDLLYTNYNGLLCRDCQRARWPDHVTDMEDSFNESDVDTHSLPFGTLVVHRPSGLAALMPDHPASAIRPAAMKLLRKAWRDVQTVERNVRYGSIME